jgi:hypothetical protein
MRYFAEFVMRAFERAHALLHYLDLRRMSPADRARNGSGLARQLEDLLDDTPFGITTLSRDAEGEQAGGLPRSAVVTFEIFDTPVWLGALSLMQY